MPLTILGLHGFLGKPEDWNSFSKITTPVPLSHEHLPLHEWASNFNKNLNHSSNHVLVGYSLGGRLGMHLLVDSPQLWSGAILISAHPGLCNIEEKKEKLASDKIWSQKFLSAPWNSLIDEWNKNSIFGNCPFYHRKEEDYSRRVLSSQLSNWSLGKQEYLVPKLKNLKIPILYLAGEEDKKYSSLAGSFFDWAEVKIIKGAAHRVPWDQPEEFKRELDRFIRYL